MNIATDKYMQYYFSPEAPMMPNTIEDIQTQMKAYTNKSLRIIIDINISNACLKIDHKAPVKQSIYIYVFLH